MGSNQQNLSGQIAVVTGAGRELGAAIADTLADRGAHVIVNDRTLEPVVEAVEAIRGRGGDASPFAFDVADRTSRIPAGRFGEPEEIARAAAFLVSEDASYIYGETLSEWWLLHGLTVLTTAIPRDLL